MMSTLEREVIEKFRLLTSEAQKRVRDLVDLAFAAASKGIEANGRDMDQLVKELVVDSART